MSGLCDINSRGEKLILHCSKKNRKRGYHLEKGKIGGYHESVFSEKLECEDVNMVMNLHVHKRDYFH
jgi:hypothetical protein